MLKKLGITTEMFFEAIQSFEGAAGRLEKVAESRNCTIFKDFAHAPSKVKATVKAVKEIFPNRDLIACLELHSYSSLTKRFLPQYKDSMKAAAAQLIMIDPAKLKSKGLDEITEADLRKAFNAPGLTLFTSRAQLESYLQSLSLENKTLLMMSSGTFGGLDLKGLASKVAIA